MSNTPRLRFPGFTGEWGKKKLVEVTKNEDNKRRPVAQTERKEGDFPYYGANGIQDYINDYIFDGDYLLVGEDGSVLTTDNTPVINWASGKFWVNNHAHVLSQKDDIPLKFISYVLSTTKIPGLVTGIPPKLNQDNLNNILIPIPPTTAEQQKIASCLSELDNLISAQGQKVDALKEKKKALMQQMFPQPGETTPKLRFPGFEGEWKEKKFKDFTYAAGKRNRQNLPYERYSISNELGFCPQSDQFEGGGGYLQDIDCRMYIIVSPKSFAYNPARINVGSIGYQDLDKDVMISSLYEVFKTTDDCDDLFLWQWLHTNAFRKMVLDVQEGGVRQYFYYDKLQNCSMRLPSILEQKKIAAFLSTLDDTINSESDKLEALKDHKKGLMQQLFPQPSK